MSFHSSWGRPGRAHPLSCFFAAVLFALLSSAAHAAPTDVSADIIWDNADAAKKCPDLCSAKQLYWMGTWRKTGWAETPVCACDDHPQPQAPQQVMPSPGQIRPPAYVPPPPAPMPPPAPGGGLMRYDYTDLPGMDLNNIPGRSFEECASACSQTSGCRAFTFATDQQRCYLKSGASGMQQSRTAVSGVMGSPAQGYPGAMQPPSGPLPSCSIGGTAKCPGCSVTCSAGQRPVCEPAVEGVTSWCARNASCRCS